MGTISLDPSEDARPGRIRRQTGPAGQQWLGRFLAEWFFQTGPGGVH